MQDGKPHPGFFSLFYPRDFQRQGFTRRHGKKNSYEEEILLKKMKSFFGFV